MIPISIAGKYDQPPLWHRLKNFLSPNRKLVAQTDLTPDEQLAIRISLRVAAVVFCLTAAGVASLSVFGTQTSGLASTSSAPQEVAVLGP